MKNMKQSEDFDISKEKLEEILLPLELITSSKLLTIEKGKFHPSFIAFCKLDDSIRLKNEYARVSFEGQYKGDILYFELDKAFVDDEINNDMLIISIQLEQYELYPVVAFQGIDYYNLLIYYKKGYLEKKESFICQYNNNIYYYYIDI